MKSQVFFLIVALTMVESLSFAQVPADSLQRTAPTDSLSDVTASQDSTTKPSPDPTVVKPNWAYVKSYYTDTKAVLKAPFHWKKPDFIKLAAITGIAVGLYAADQGIRDWSQEHKTDFTTGLSEVVDPLGNGRYLWITSGAVFLGGQVIKNDKATRVGLLILESQLINGVLGQIVKIATSRYRPRDGARYNEWEGPNLTPRYSFPSGHAQTAFALMTVVAMEYRHIKFIPPIAYSLAVLTCLSRINQDAHWSSDIFVGSVMGFFVSRVIVQQHTKPGSRLGLTPLMGKRQSGLSLTYRF